MKFCGDEARSFTKTKQGVEPRSLVENYQEVWRRLSKEFCRDKARSSAEMSNEFGRDEARSLAEMKQEVWWR